MCILIGRYLCSVGLDRYINDITVLTFSLVCCIKEIDSMLPCVCSIIDHRRRQNVLRKSVMHEPLLFCSYHFDLIICDLILNICIGNMKSIC